MKVNEHDLYYNTVSKLNQFIQGKKDFRHNDSFHFFIRPVVTMDKMEVYDIKFNKIISFEINVINQKVKFNKDIVKYDSFMDLYKGLCAYVDIKQGTQMLKKVESK